MRWADYEAAAPQLGMCCAQLLLLGWGQLLTWLLFLGQGWTAHMNAALFMGDGCVLLLFLGCSGLFIMPLFLEQRQLLVGLLLLRWVQVACAAPSPRMEGGLLTWLLLLRWGMGCLCGCCFLAGSELHMLCCSSLRQGFLISSFSLYSQAVCSYCSSEALDC